MVLTHRDCRDYPSVTWCCCHTEIRYYPSVTWCCCHTEIRYYLNVTWCYCHRDWRLDITRVLSDAAVTQIYGHCHVNYMPYLRILSSLNYGMIFVSPCTLYTVAVSNLFVPFRMHYVPAQFDCLSFTLHKYFFNFSTNERAQKSPISHPP